MAYTWVFRWCWLISTGKIRVFRARSLLAFFMTLNIIIAFLVFSVAVRITHHPERFSFKLHRVPKLLNSRVPNRYLRSQDFINGKIRNFGWSNSEAGNVIHSESLFTYQRYLKIRHIRNLQELAFPNTSSVEMIGNSKTFQLGDEIKVEIVLRDELGNNILRGGDILRIWMSDKNHNANVAGYVIDHRNGTYTGVIKALWVGEPEIKVSIANTLQHIGIALNTRKKLGISSFIFGQFRKGKLKEQTNCSTISRFEWKHEFCNFTEINFGMAWYCEKPKIIGLSCEDLVSYNGTLNTRHSKSQENLMRRHVRIKSSCMVKVVSNGTLIHKVPDTECNKIPPGKTWALNIPTGFVYKDIWYCLNCNNSVVNTQSNYIKCLSNSYVLFVGDSTIRNIFSVLLRVLKLEMTFGPIGRKTWHQKLSSKPNMFNITLTWGPHEMPFYNGFIPSLRMHFKSTAYMIDQIGDKTHAVVILHLYIHLTSIPIHVYIEHVRNTRGAIIRLLKRSPHAKIIIKGPYAATETYHPEPLDYMHRVMSLVWKKELEILKDKIYFVDFWDMTVSTEQVSVHSGDRSDSRFLQLLFSYIC